MKVFYVKDLTRLKDYGFCIFNEQGDYLLQNQKRVSCVRVNTKNHLMTLFSPSRDTIAVLCKMYVDKVFEIFDETHFVDMKVSEEEQELILQFRKQKELNEKGERNNERD